MLQGCRLRPCGTLREACAARQPERQYSDAADVPQDAIPSESSAKDAGIRFPWFRSFDSAALGLGFQSNGDRAPFLLIHGWRGRQFATPPKSGTMASATLSPAYHVP